MDRRAVGVLDTGVGGLTAVREMRALMPGEDIVFFADTARVPYGGRSAEEITAFSRENAARLAACGVKALLVACGTITSTCLDAVAEAARVPVCGVIAPAAAEAAATSRSGSIGVLCTAATARTDAFGREIRALRADAAVCTHGTGELVPFIEAGRIGPGDAEVSRAVDAALLPLRGLDMDTLVLGCTHFPLLEGIFAEKLPGVALINSGAAGARGLGRELAGRGLLSGRTAGGSLRCLVTGDTELFGRNAELFLAGGGFTIEKA